MSKTRDRHGRGLRGPVAMTNPYTRRPAPVRGNFSRAETFLDCLEASIARVNEVCPEAIAGIDIGVEDVPSAAAMWEGFVSHDAVPLAGAIDAEPTHPARIVLYRRPIERRALDPVDLGHLVHHTLVEQVSVLTGRSVRDIDPNFDEDY
jgi:predicted Zn-dependent protease with MMP-like domain